MAAAWSAFAAPIRGGPDRPASGRPDIADLEHDAASDLLLSFTAKGGSTVGISGLLSLLAAMVVGGGIGTAAMISVVDSQTSPPSHSPASISEPAIQYGSNN